MGERWDVTMSWCRGIETVCSGLKPIYETYSLSSSEESAPVSMRVSESRSESDSTTVENPPKRSRKKLKTKKRKRDNMKIPNGNGAGTSCATLKSIAMSNQASQSFGTFESQSDGPERSPKQRKRFVPEAFCYPGLSPKVSATIAGLRRSMIAMPSNESDSLGGAMSMSSQDSSSLQLTKKKKTKRKIWKPTTGSTFLASNSNDS